jgi:hypothetical protein
MATRSENGPSVGDTETALGCVRAADTISKLTIAEIVPLPVACFEMASGLVRPASKAQTREAAREGLAIRQTKTARRRSGRLGEGRPVLAG